MYNNIGLKTVRGSGTNGYIQTNLAALPANWKRFRGRRRAFDAPEPESKKKLYKASKELVDFNKKRAVEVKVFEYREKLEDQDFAEENIEEKVAAYRKYMLEKMAAGEFDDEAQYCGHNTSQRGTDVTRAEEFVEQKKKNLKMQRALGISGDHVHGKAFDQDLQLKEKNERLAATEANMTTEQKIAFKEQNYLDRFGDREPQDEPLHRPAPSERVDNDWRYGRGGYRDRMDAKRTSDRDYRSRRQFSRSNSAGGERSPKPSRKRARSRSPDRRERRRRRSRSRDKEEEGSSKKQKIERWKAESEDEAPAKDKSKKKRKKDKEKKKKKKKRAVPEGQEQSDAPPEEASGKKKKKKRKKSKKQPEKEEGEVDDISGAEASA